MSTDFANTSAPLFIGLDVGSATVKAVVADAATGGILWSAYERHGTRQQTKCLEMLEAALQAFPNARRDAFRLIVTGSGGAAVADAAGGRFIQEVHALSLAVERWHPDVRTVIELGGEDAKIIVLQTDPRTGARRKSASMNDKCAGGTGAVIDKVASKLGLDPERVGAMPYLGVRTHLVAGKCGVFAETDINGLQKQGVPPDELMASLFDAIVLQNLTVLARGHTLQPPVLLLGGPNAFLAGMRDCWRRHLSALWTERGIELPRRPIEELVLAPDHALLFGAWGATVFGVSEWRRDPRAVPVFQGTAALRRHIEQEQLAGRARGIAALMRDDAEADDFRQRYAVPPWSPPSLEPGAEVAGFIGLDGGSTSTKAVLIDRNRQILAKAYRLSCGNPIRDAQEVLGALEAQVAASGGRLRVLGLATTGYAKDLLGDALGADVALVETVAHTNSGLHFAPDADIICDVGGQDIKVVLLRQGAVRDFRLNTQCSAGNGFYLQATAAAFGISVEDYADTAFSARTMPEFGYGCAVFLQSDIVDFQRQGWRPNEILAGLAAVLPKNIWLYVCQMPNVAQVGSRFLLQGGTQRNLAAVKAQVDFLHARFAGTGITPRIEVHPHAAEAGAVGCALEVLRRHEDRDGFQTRFIGFDVLRSIHHETRRDEDTRCHLCGNRCLRTFIDLASTDAQGGAWQRRLIVANCDRGAAATAAEAGAIAKRLAGIRDTTPDLLTSAVTRLFESPDVEPVPKRAGWMPGGLRAGARRARVRIGMPRVLNLYSTAPFFAGFFRSLGIGDEQLVWSDYTSEALYREGARRNSVDPCYPSKLAAAHLHDLLRKHGQGTPLTHVFFPIVDGFPTWMEGVQGSRACPSSMAAVEAAHAALTKEADLFAECGIRLLKPFCTLNDRQACAWQLHQTWAAELGLTKSETLHAVDQGYAALERHDGARRREGREVLALLERENRVGIVVLARPYHADPGINHGIGQEFQRRGYAVIAHDALPTDDEYLARLFGPEGPDAMTGARGIDDVWKNSFAENSSRKIWAAKFVARHPNLVALELSNFKCGHDAPVYHTIEAILESAGKPFFHFRDIDENRPAASIRIRIETIVHFLERYQRNLPLRTDGVSS